jgi:hypothetical protein
LIAVRLAGSSEAANRGCQLGLLRTSGAKSGVDQEHDPADRAQELSVDGLAIPGVHSRLRILAKILTFCVANRALHGTPPQRVNSRQAALTRVVVPGNLLKVSVKSKPSFIRAMARFDTRESALRLAGESPALKAVTAEMSWRTAPAPSAPKGNLRTAAPMLR